MGFLTVFIKTANEANQKFSLLNINSVPDSVCVKHCFPKASAKAAGPHKNTPTFELKKKNIQYQCTKMLWKSTILPKLQYIPWMLSSDGAEFIIPVGFTISSLLLKTSNGVIFRLILNSKMGSLHFKDMKRILINIRVSLVSWLKAVRSRVFSPQCLSSALDKYCNLGNRSCLFPSSVFLDFAAGP